MNPNLNIYLMTNSIEREHREAQAAHARLVADAVRHRPARVPHSATGRVRTLLVCATSLLRGHTGGLRPLTPEEAG
jgi:hypothetical protein